MNILSIDFGQRKIGLAITEGLLAEPFGIIETANWPLEITRICEEQSIDKIVIGLSGGLMEEKQKQFAAKVAQLTNLPVEFEDETLTSQEALAKMREIGKRVKDEDAIAAALILQSYLDTQSRKTL